LNGSIVVTGAAGGIGRAITGRLAANPSFTVIGVDLAPELGLTDDNIIPVQVDLTGDDGVAAVKETVERADLPLLGLVNNAGITRDARLINMTEDDLLAVLDVNLGAVFRLSTALAGSMSDGGSIVNIASRAYLGNFGQFNYSMSKGGVVGLTRALAISLAPRVRVNAVAPGLTATEMVETIPDDVIQRMISAIPLGRMGRPSEIADVVAWLYSPGSSYVTGQVVVVGGGRSLTR
jgi:NAD(P)-dependent dehydrogenase (short-subunit alcohol dehydrogenase family)